MFVVIMHCMQVGSSCASTLVPLGGNIMQAEKTWPQVDEKVGYIVTCHISIRVIDPSSTLLETLYFYSVIAL